MKLLRERSERKSDNLFEILSQALILDATTLKGLKIKLREFEGAWKTARGKFL